MIAPFCMTAVLAMVSMAAVATPPGYTARAQTRIPVTGRVDRLLTSFDEMMLSVMSKYKVPGAALAVAKDGRLVYARGFGYADREKKIKMQPTSLFRIASVSKPITAVAIFQLIESRELRLDDKIFSILDHKPHLENGGEVDPRLAEITILQLLQHTGGFDRDKSFDPMFISGRVCKALGSDRPAGADEIIRYMMGRRLDFDPGERYVYSNFGYCLLGRVIEKLSGKSYEDAVRDNLLIPIGAGSMRVGRTRPEHRMKNEVVYYDAKNRTGKSVFASASTPGERVPVPYGGFCIEAMDSHGAWIASTVDLLRFSAALDLSNRDKVLSNESIERMFGRPQGPAGFERNGKPKRSFYACGWSVRPFGETGKVSTWHMGRLSGTASVLVRRHDGLSWAVLFNADEAPSGTYLGSVIDPLVHKAARKVKKWPRRDLFKQYR